MAKTRRKKPPKDFNIMKHELVPTHIILTGNEKDDFYKNHDLTPDQLPKIMHNDPVCVSIGAKPGQVIKIIRESHTAKKAVAYRLVVESND